VSHPGPPIRVRVRVRVRVSISHCVPSRTLTYADCPLALWCTHGPALLAFEFRVRVRVRVMVMVQLS